MRIEKAITERNWKEFSEIVIKDSNQLHAICIDTFPPLFYLSENTIQLITIIDTINNLENEMIVL